MNLELSPFKDNKPILDKEALERSISNVHPDLINITVINREEAGVLVVGSDKNNRQMLIDPTNYKILTNPEENFKFDIRPWRGLVKVNGPNNSQGYVELATGRIVVRPESGSRVEDFYNGSDLIVVDGPQRNPFADIVRVADGAKIMHFEPGQYPYVVGFKYIYFRKHEPVKNDEIVVGQPRTVFDSKSQEKTKYCIVDEEKNNILMKMCGFNEADELSPIFQEREKTLYVLGGETSKVEKISNFLKIKKDGKFGIVDLSQNKLLVPIEYDEIKESDFIPKKLLDGTVNENEEFTPFVVLHKSGEFYLATPDGLYSKSFKTKEEAVQQGHTIFVDFTVK